MLLIVVGWPGPRPYLHDHQHFGEDGVASVGLERHLIQYHSHESGGVDSELLHFHWLVIPPQGGEPVQNCCVNCCSIDELRLDSLSDVHLVNLQQLHYEIPFEVLLDFRVEPCGVHSSSPPFGVCLHQMYCSMNC